MLPPAFSVSLKLRIVRPTKLHHIELSGKSESELEYVGCGQSQTMQVSVDSDRAPSTRSPHSRRPTPITILNADVSIPRVRD